jgi:hypothetical protein
MSKLGLRADFVANFSFCDANLYSDGPRTLEGLVARGPELCPHLAKCRVGGFIHPENHQCVMMNGAEVAKNAVKERHSIKEEMKDFRSAGLRPPSGWVVSRDRKEFSVISNNEEAIRLVEYFAHVAILDEIGMGEIPERTHPSSGGVGPTFEDVISGSIDPVTGAIDLQKIEKLEGRFGTNGGRGCDVASGPCSCGAWH